MNEREPTNRDPEAEEELPPPTGTLFILLLYMMLMAGMWLAIYLLLLES